MAELEPLPRSFWLRWPVRAPGDIVKDGVVFHPVRGFPDLFAPHESNFALSRIQIETFRGGAVALVDEMRKHHG